MTEIFAAKAAEFADGNRKIVSVDGREVVVLRHKDTYYAYENYCLHNGGPVGEGIVIEKVEAVLGDDQTFVCERFNSETLHLVCPWHGWEYNVETGACAGNPRRRLRKYQTVEREDSVYVIA